MRYRHAIRTLPLLVIVLILGACADAAELSGPKEEFTDEPAPLAVLTCTASIEAGTVNCASSNRLLGASSSNRNGAVREVILGGQGENVLLTSSNIEIVADTFAFDVTVQNLIPQALGTDDGVNVDYQGVRVFFNSGPNSTGGGVVTVANPDGVETFTASSQPYYQYDWLVQEDAAASPKRWKLQFTPEVDNFAFTVYVSSAVQYPNGYVDEIPNVITLNPGETRTLAGTVRNVVGRELPGESVSWTTTDATIASVAGSQVTAGLSRGFADLTAASGPRPGLSTAAISVCQAVDVVNGTTIPTTIASTDCFSSYRGYQARPSTSHYADLYRVNLVTGQTLTVTLDSRYVLDTYVLLAHPTLGVVVAANDDDPTYVLGGGSRLIHTATESGVHVLEATTYYSGETGNYTLQVTISD